MNQGMRRPPVEPVYGLWLCDGGADGRGAWMAHSTPNGLLPVFFQRLETAKARAGEERKEGRDVLVMELRVMAVVSMHFVKTPSRFG